MLFQVLCGFEPIFYTTHPNEESYFFIVKRNAAFLSNLLSDKATATAKLSAYSDYFKTHDETSQPIKVFIIHYNVIAHKIKTEI